MSLLVEQKTILSVKVNSNKIMTDWSFKTLSVKSISGLSVNSRYSYLEGMKLTFHLKNQVRFSKTN